MSGRQGRRTRKWSRWAKAFCMSVPLLSAPWLTWQTAIGADATAQEILPVAHCMTDTNCQCPGCTAFRDQQRRQVAPPAVGERPAFCPPTDPSICPPTVESPSDATHVPPTTPSTDDQVPTQEPSTEPFTTEPTADDTQSTPDANRDTTPSPFSDTTNPSPSTSDQLASAFGGSADGFGAPSMIGDFFGGGLILSSDSFGDVPVSLPVAAGDRRHKMAENGSPLPQDRFFFNYNHFHNAVRDIRGVDVNVNRYLFGVERTFLDRMASVELRVPFASGLSATQPADARGQTTGTEFGNVSTTLKGLLWRDACNALSVGMTTIWPTAQGGSVTAAQNFGRMTFDNGSVHFAPFVGYLRTPNACSFHQYFMQFDFDTGGYEVNFNNQLPGRIQEQTLMYHSYSYGRWVYRNPCGIISGIAPIVELHYTTTVQDVDTGPAPFAVLDNRRDILNMMGGLHLQLADTAALRLSGGAPLRTGTNREFDAEFSVQFLRYF